MSQRAAHSRSLRNAGTLPASLCSRPVGPYRSRRTGCRMAAGGGTEGGDGCSLIPPYTNACSLRSPGRAPRQLHPTGEQSRFCHVQMKMGPRRANDRPRGAEGTSFSATGTLAARPAGFSPLGATYREEALMGTQTVRLQRDGARVLLAEARREFKNAAHEFCRGDESQRSRIDGCVELIGRLEQTTEDRWPRDPVGPDDGPKWLEDRIFEEFEFSAETMDHLRRVRDEQADFVSDFDRGVIGTADPGYFAGQVFLLHVLNGVCTANVGDRVAA